MKVKFIRQEKENQVNVVLKSYEGSTEPEKKEVKSDIEGATFEALTYQQGRELNIDGGVVVRKIGEGKWKQAGVKENFIITSIDKVPVESIEDLNEVLANKSGGILVEGMYLNREKAIFAVTW